MVKVAIIGGGAAGLACSSTLKKCDVFLFEQNDTCGKKILASGNGRCNISNRNLGIHFYNQDHTLINRVLNEFDIDDFFIQKGLLLQEQGDLVYPYSNQAKSVKHVLLKNSNNANIIHSKVSNILKKNNQYVICYQEQKLVVDYVVLAIGSSASVLSKGGSYSLIEQLGIQLTPRYPSLVQFTTLEVYKKLEGVRVKGIVSLLVDNHVIEQKTGEIQFTNYGLSGICVMQLSRFYHLYKEKNVSIKINIFPDVENIDEFLHERKNKFGDFFLEGVLNDKLALVINENSIDINNFVFTVSGVKDELSAQVISGGVKLSELNNDFESLICPNLFIVGEVLDVDGDCGGYNLHFAFGSGYLAAKSIKRRIKC